MTRGIGVGLAGLLAASALHPPAPVQSTHRTVVFALQRSERLHVFDAGTLEHLGYFKTGPFGDSLGVRSDGRRVLLHQPQTLPDGSTACCSLRTIDLATREMCSMSDYAAPIMMGPAIVASGDTLFNADTLERLAVPRGFFMAYVSKFSPDGRYVARPDRGPVLAFTDLVSRTRKEIPIPEEARAGDWIGDRFALISPGGGQGRVWLVGAQDEVLPAPRAITWPERDAQINATFAVGTDLIAYQRFGRSLKLDPREREPAVPGGALVIPTARGGARRVAPDIYFAALVPGLDGRSLYGLEAGPLKGGPTAVRLLRLDVRTGAVMATLVIRDPKIFPDASFDVWSLALARVPENLLPRGETQLVPCRTR